MPREATAHLNGESYGVAIPYGIYDPLGNRGAVIVGVSHNTAAFAANAIAHWWSREGCHRYTGSGKLLILADTGGSNGCRARAWKTELRSQLANGHRLAVTVAHYPTGASKWNPIEHRLFSEISRNWAGEPLDSYAKILNFIRTTSTQTGLAVSAYLDRRHYPLGDKPSPEQFRQLRLEPGDTLPKWNYTINPIWEVIPEAFLNGVNGNTRTFWNRKTALASRSSLLFLRPFSLARSLSHVVEWASRVATVAASAIFARNGSATLGPQPRAS